MPDRYLLPAAAALLAAAPLAAATAQDVDLDRAPSVGKVFTGEVPDGGGAAVSSSASPVGGSDPVMRVYDAATDGLIAENDDSAGSLAPSRAARSTRASRPNRRSRRSARP